MSSYQLFFTAMASRCEIRLAASGEPQARELAQFAIDEVGRIEKKYSRYRADSVVSNITRQAGKDWVWCDDETLGLLDHAGDLYRQSDGLFDITSGVLRQAWNFSEAEIPNPDSLQALCALIDWPSVQRMERRVRLPQAGMELDFGGFGKEYAADRAAGVLHAHGVQHGYVNLGGDVRVIGPQPHGQPWTIGIQDPRCREKSIASIALENGAVASSGDYERFFDVDGRRYGHILHPQHGVPVAFWRSVSVIAPTALMAGGLATIAMLKQEQALAFLERENAVFLAAGQDGIVHYNRTTQRA